MKILPTGCQVGNNPLEKLGIVLQGFLIVLSHSHPNPWECPGWVRDFFFPESQGFGIPSQGLGSLPEGNRQLFLGTSTSRPGKSQGSCLGSGAALGKPFPAMSRKTGRDYPKNPPVANPSFQTDPKLPTQIPKSPSRSQSPNPKLPVLIPSCPSRCRAPDPKLPTPNPRSRPHPGAAAASRGSRAGLNSRGLPGINSRPSAGTTRDWPRSRNPNNSNGKGNFPAWQEPGGFGIPDFPGFPPELCGSGQGFRGILGSSQRFGMPRPPS